MRTKNQQLYDIINSLPEDISNKVLDYIEYLKYTSVINNAPENLKIRSKKDLREKLEKGIQDTENGKVYSIDEAFAEIDTLLAD